MTVLQKPPVTMSSHGSRTLDVASDDFPKGLRVLVIDDDITTLMVVESMLRKCLYLVTTCSHATVALNLLREKKDSYDVVISDVHMPDMDGFSLLEFIGLEMDLPVIMMSVDEDTRTVMKGIRHGACDYLIKPLREEELKNIWQHVVRRKIESKAIEYSGSLEDNDRHRWESDSAEHTSSVNEGLDVTLEAQKNRKGITKEDDGELLNDNQTTSKKPRVVWSVDLHEQFVHAVRHLGVEKAVPKRILEMMNVPGLTRENVASHLQKFRLYLKRLPCLAYPGGVIPGLVGGPIDSNLIVNPLLGRFDIQTLATSGQIPPQTLVALHTELYGHPGVGAFGGCSAPTPTLVSPGVAPSVHAYSRSRHSAGAFSTPNRLHVPGPSVSGYLDRCMGIGEVFDQVAFRSPVAQSCFGIEQHRSLMSGMVKEGDLDYFDDGRMSIPNDPMGVFNECFNI